MPEEWCHIAGNCMDSNNDNTVVIVLLLFWTLKGSYNADSKVINYIVV